MKEDIKITKEILINDLGFTFNECLKPDNQNSSNFIKTGTSSKGRRIPFRIYQCSNGSFALCLYGDIQEELIFVEQLQILYLALTGSELKYNKGE